MARKKRNKQSVSPSTSSRSSVRGKTPIYQWVILIVVPLLLYANTFQHKYALDDDIVIRKNEFTQQGIDGIEDIFANETFVGFFGQRKDLVAGGRYRPLSVATFAVELDLFGQRPALSHFFNTLLYLLTGLVIFWALRLLLIKHQYWKSWAQLLPFLGALIWLVHPIHTEVVANIKGRDEILAMLFSMGALGSAVKYFDTGDQKWFLAGLAALLLGMLSKENAFTFLFVIPFALFIFRNASWQEALKQAAFFLIPAAIVLGMRWMALDGLSVSGSSVKELMNNPFLEANFAKKYATIFYTLGKYIELQLIPHTLTHDYYPYHIELVTFGNAYVLGSIALHLSMGGVIIYGLIKRASLVVFALGFYLITLSVVSNLFFPVGTFMAERLVFMPSLGIALVMGWFIIKVSQWRAKGVMLPATGKEPHWFMQRNRIGLILLLVVLAGYGFKTVDRNPVWKNNQTLFLTDIHTSKNSAKLNNAAGGMLYDMSRADTTSEEASRRYMQRSKKYLQRATEIHPGYNAAWLTLGNIYYFLDNNVDSALYAYEQAGGNDAYKNMIAIGQQAEQAGNFQGAEKCFAKYISIKPHHSIGYQELADLYLSAKQPDRAIRVIKDAMERFPQNSGLLNKMGLAYGKGKQNFAKAIDYFLEAVEADPTNAEALENLGVAYGFMDENAKSLEYFKKAHKYNPNDAKLNQNLGKAYFRMGEIEKGKKYILRANELGANPSGK